MDFKDFHLNQNILNALTEADYKAPTPIQEKAIPPVLAGRDLFGCAQTGTGKTAAFAVPILQILSGNGVRPRRIRSLVLTPTRELALQIYESFRAYGRHTGLRACVVFGGVPQKAQVESLRRGVDILVATPGRLNDLMNQGFIRLDDVRIFVLDEADRMLDMGFINDVKKISSKLPAERQTLLFSATMPPEIAEIAASVLKEPEKIMIAPPATTVDAIEQSVYFVDKANKPKLLTHLLRDESIRSALVFTRTKHGADRVVRSLVKAGIDAQSIHGDKSQRARQNALGSFRKGELRVLVATDIAARGIDVENISCVFNYDIPEVPETYVHRIGRTGRAGQSGRAVAFCCIDEKKDFDGIEKLTGKRIPETGDNPYPMTVTVPSPKAARGRGGMPPARRGGPSRRQGPGAGRRNPGRRSDFRAGGAEKGSPRG